MLAENQLRHFGVFTDNFEHISHNALVFPLLTSSKYRLAYGLKKTQAQTEWDYHNSYWIPTGIHIFLHFVHKFDKNVWFKPDTIICKNNFFKCQEMNLSSIA